MKKLTLHHKAVKLFSSVALLTAATGAVQAAEILHDAEYYVLDL